MGVAEQKLVMDMVAWAGNVSSSVMIIFVNKILMNTTGYGFKYGGVSLEPTYIAPWRGHLNVWKTLGVLKHPKFNLHILVHSCVGIEL